MQRAGDGTILDIAIPGTGQYHRILFSVLFYQEKGFEGRCTGKE
jgi:hypothetical protein